MALKTPTLSCLSSTISQQSSILTELLEKNNLPHPSFAYSASGLRNWDIPDVELQMARLALIEAAENILHLATGPSDYLKMTMIEHKFDSFVIDALSEWQVYEAVPLEGSITYTELAAKVKVPEGRLRRVLHHAINNHIFFAPTADSISHTSISAEAALDPFLYAWIEHNYSEVGPCAHKITEAIEKHGDSEDPAESAAALALPLGEDKLFEWMEKDGVGEPSKEVLEGKIDKSDRTRGWRNRRFGRAMHSIMIGGIHAAAHVNNGFDWGALGKGTVVDVGGSKGHVSLELALKYPDLKIFVQDFESLRGSFEITIPADLRPRVSFQVHDFFTPQPTSADVYLLKHVLHDWSDGKAVEILRNLVLAMKPGNRIVIMEGIMPEIGEGPSFVNKMMSGIDLQMMTLFNAKERRKSDWEDLIKSTDGRLVLKAFRQPPGAAAQMIEVVFEG